MAKPKETDSRSARKGVRFELLVAVSLMSIIPFLVLAYVLTNYVFNAPERIFQATLIVVFAVWLATAGYMIAKKMIIPIIELAVEARNIAKGRYDSKITVNRDDELGDIANVVNIMTSKIRNYIGELQEYSEKTAFLNLQIHKKVLTLTNLMQLGDLISAGNEFSEIADFAADKIANEIYGGFSAIFIKEDSEQHTLTAVHNNSGQDLQAKKLEGHMLLVEKFLAEEEYVVIDSQALKKPWQKEMKDALGNINVVFFPIKVAGNIVGVILLGNFTKGTVFEDEQVDMLRAFEKEIGLAYQSAQAFKKVKSLEIIDSITGLYTLTYLEERLNDEINRAVYYQRPCSLIMIGIDDFDEYANYYGEEKTKQVLRQIAKLLSGSISSVGKIARSDDGEFGILLPETNKRESLEIAEEIRKKIENMEVSSAQDNRMTVSIGVSENPIDGVNGKDIIKKARDYAVAAKKSGKNKVLGEEK
ncbi:MAG: diguanylate cyclase [Candidatus Omnitrophota bacterium]|nr:diguanylate cyclase [Candidatus Omnitrophota bacterium]MBU1894500.1 diguanylate cyclase [Candidatus Omnitrophota bacterium]